jgi:hypothetical protein
MRRISLLTLALMAVALAVVLPAQASSHKCQPHAVSYAVSGTLVSGTLSADPGTKKTYSGTLTVHVTKTNHHGKADKGQTKLYTLSHAHVSFGAGVDKTSPAAASGVHLKGKITTLAKKCNQTGCAPTITIKKVELHRARSHKS